MPLPFFKYHPNPIATGSIVPSDQACTCCGEKKEFIYTGPIYAVDKPDGPLCPWCIAHGSAAQRLHASFVDEDGIGSYGSFESVPDEAIHKIAQRTPGFCAWQQEQRWTHCGDAAAFMGRAGKTERQVWGEEAIQASTGWPDGPRWQAFFAALDSSG
ncbi:CbrC family protein [Dyella sp. C11]|uniref:CbrC family protein n=1 Tax=Dyella sp. C11 TaxID=2126991 RepID=UPI000D659095|nr:CbrC family protein [Dyella sp. C11]